MKIRVDFVTNSSSSSYIVEYAFDISALLEIIKKNGMPNFHLNNGSVQVVSLEGNEIELYTEIEEGNPLEYDNVGQLLLLAYLSADPYKNYDPEGDLENFVTGRAPYSSYIPENKYTGTKKSADKLLREYFTKTDILDNIKVLYRDVCNEDEDSCEDDDEYDE